MSKLSKLFVLLALMCGIFMAFGARAEAASPTTSVFDGETHTPTAFRATCTDGVPVDFATYPSNVNLNLTTGRITYRVNVAWRRCPGSGETRAYAIYASPQICPTSGYYGLNGTATDCVKYIGSPPFSGPGNGLTCPGGTNQQCVTGSFGAVQEVANQPPTTTRTESIVMSTNIPGWGSQPATSSYTVSSDMCQYYKIPPPNFNAFTTNRCVRITIRVNWRSISIPPTITCASSSATTNPASPEAGQDFNLTVGFSAQSNGTGGGGTNYSIFVTLPGTNPPAINGATGGVAAFGSPTFHDTPFGSGTLPGGIPPPPGRNVPIQFATPGVKNGTYQIVVGGASPNTITCPFQVNIMQKPYHRVYGGDVLAGAGFGDACIPHWAAIIGWNRAVAPYTGAGSQLASFALNTIVDYASGAPDGAAAAGAAQWTNPKRLAFANTGIGESGPGVPGGTATAPASTYGGGFHRGNIICAPDYYGGRPAGATPITGGGVQAFTVDPTSQGDYFRTGDLALTGGGAIGSVAGNGRDLAIYVNGNVFIETNITYQNQASYASVNDIPSFRLVVSGNIYVHPNVSQLDGLYVAQPNSTSTGFFYTCGSRAWTGRTPLYVPNQTDLARTTSGAENGCSLNRLRVYGAVVAETVKLLRTPGTRRNASITERFGANNTAGAPGDPAEEFIFTPEAWFKGTNSGSGGYDSVTALPPIL